MLPGLCVEPCHQFAWCPDCSGGAAHHLPVVAHGARCVADGAALEMIYERKGSTAVMLIRHFWRLGGLCAFVENPVDFVFTCASASFGFTERIYGHYKINKRASQSYIKYRFCTIVLV